MPAPRKKKEITLDEFKAWLEGVEELQPKGWTPDATQWKLIRNKIKCIVEKVVPQATAPSMWVSPSLNQPPVSTSAPVQTPEPPRMPPQLPPKSALEELVQDPEVVAQPAATPAALTPSAPVPLTPGVDGKTHTPHIDSSNGNFTSSFE